MTRWTITCPIAGFLTAEVEAETAEEAIATFWANEPEPLDVEWEMHERLDGVGDPSEIRAEPAE